MLLATINPPRWLVRRLLQRAQRKPLDFIYGDDGSLYMERYQLVSWHNWLDWGARIHITWRSDIDPYLHDHPWDNISWLLENPYVEELPDSVIAHMRTKKVYRKQGSIIWRAAKDRHRLDLTEDHTNRVRPVISLFITFKWKNRWGFYVNGAKIYWKEYVNNRKSYGPKT